MGEGLTAALSQPTGGFALHQEPGAGWEIREGREEGESWGGKDVCGGPQPRRGDEQPSGGTALQKEEQR